MRAACFIFLLVSHTLASLTEAQAAMVFTEANRVVEDLPNTTLLFPTAPLSDFEDGFSFFENPTPPTGRLLSRASQRSEVRPEFVRVLSTVGGDLSMGRSFLVVTFTLSEPTPYTAEGMLGLTGTDGFLCVSLYDLGHLEAPVFLSLIGGPQAPDALSFSFGGVLPAGTFTLDALAYAGGGENPAAGNLQLLFAVPEPSSLWLVAAFSLCWRRRNVTAPVSSRHLHPSKLTRAARGKFEF